MKILEHGSPDYLKEPVVFTCNRCGCRFEADNTEYRTRQIDYNGDLCYSISCPECDNEVTADIPHK